MCRLQAHHKRIEGKNEFKSQNKMRKNWNNFAFFFFLLNKNNNSSNQPRKKLGQ